MVSPEVKPLFAFSYPIAACVSAVPPVRHKECVELHGGDCTGLGRRHSWSVWALMFHAKIAQSFLEPAAKGKDRLPLDQTVSAVHFCFVTDGSGNNIVIKDYLWHPILEEPRVLTKT